MNIKTKAVLIGVGGVFVWWQYRKAKAAVVETITETLNPASPKNFVYQGTQTAGKNLGKWLYEVTH